MSFDANAYTPCADQIQVLKHLIDSFPANSIGQDQLKKIAPARIWDSTPLKISSNVLKQDGVYFTPPLLAKKLIAKLSDERYKASRRIYDPACGTGNLLMEVAKKLPVEKSFRRTLSAWGEKLAGTDLNPYFVEICKHRLALLALSRGALLDRSSLGIDIFFPNIKVGNCLYFSEDYKYSDIIVLNPPFNYFNARSLDWAAGKTNSAALHFIHAIESSANNASLLAILPDVLRSGARYGKWRSVIERATGALSSEVFGQFSKKVDVDVFLLKASKAPRLVCRPHHNQVGKILDSWSLEFESAQTFLGTIAKKFEVRVGPVVPNRDPKTGPIVPYFHSRILNPWEEIGSPLEYRRFSGTLYQGPLVALRRTSRPGDKWRALATVINLSEPMALENHVILCRPRDRSVEACRQLMSYLKSQVINDYLDKKIRCRHLTVGVIKEIPYN